MIPRMERMRLG